jgi:MOSC domain-containing protein YiiM
MPRERAALWPAVWVDIRGRLANSQPIMGTVVSIHRVARRDAAADAIANATFTADFGLTGDWRSRRGRGRQITIIEAEALEHIAATLGLDAVPPGASRRQVVVRGIRLRETIGKQLRLGPLLVAVHDDCAPCANMERQIGTGARAALDGRGGVCGRIIEGGVLRPGDPVAVAP